MTTSLVDIFLPGKDFDRYIGERLGKTSHREEAALGLFDTNGDVTPLPGKVSLDHLRSKPKKDRVYIGGAPGAGMLAQYPSIIELMRKKPQEEYAFTLGDMAQDIEMHPGTPPIRWVYHTPVWEMLETAEKNGTLEQLLQILKLGKKEDYLKLRFIPDVHTIGHTLEYMNLGIGEPVWTLEGRLSPEQEKLNLPTQRNPDGMADDPLLILAGQDYLNPCNMVAIVGGSGYTTFAGGMIVTRKDQVPKDVLKMLGLNIPDEKLPDKHTLEGVDEFLNKVVTELKGEGGLSSHYGDGFNGVHLNAAIVGIVTLERGLPQKVEYKGTAFYNPIPAK